MGYPEDRTHGADSAIDDEITPAANMTEQADAHQALPGSEAIPADMPNAAHGDISLEYNLQNFNALVAANTAMIGEVSFLNEKVDLLTQQRDSFMEGLDLARADGKAYLAQIKDLQAADRDSRTRIDAKDAELELARDERTFLQRRLDRALGYLDATLDEQDSNRTPLTHTVPAPPPAVGPNFDDIERPRRRQDSDGLSGFAAVRMAEPYAPGRRHRRYG